MADTDEIEFRAGRRATTYTDIKDWVPLSGVSKMAVLLYIYLRMHVNRKRGDRRVKATMHTLAKLMGYSRGDKISGFLAELVAVKAVEAKRIGLTGRYVFTVHEEPPSDYAGPLGLPDWYEDNRGDLSAERAAAKAVRDARRETRAKKTQVNPVAPDSGQLGLGAPVTPDSGQLDTPDSGQPVTPDSGREPDVLEPDGVEPDVKTSLSRAAAKPRGAQWLDPAQNQREIPSPNEQTPNPEDPVKTLVAELVQVSTDAGTRWKYADQNVRTVLLMPDVASRPFALVRAALLELAAQKHGKCWSPKLIEHWDSDRWDGVAARLEGPRPAAANPAPAQRRASENCPWYCDERGRRIVDVPDDKFPGKMSQVLVPCDHQPAMAEVS